MYIVDKNKDYYDYLSHIYGLDKKIVLDRRGSKKIDDGNIVDLFYHLYYYEKANNFLILEVGNVQYLIRVFKIKCSKGNELGHQEFVSCEMKIEHIFNNHVHLYDTPISIRAVSVKTNWSWGKHYSRKSKYVISDNYQDTIERVFEKVINLPILAGTQITSLIAGEEIWKELQNYISSLDNDKDVSIPMTDVEKAETHGFDKVTSFRHPIK